MSERERKREREREKETDSQTDRQTYVVVLRYDLTVIGV